MTEPRSAPQRRTTTAGHPRDELVLADVIARLRRAMRRAARAVDPHSGLSVAQLELMSYLAEHPGARPGELARLLRLAPNSVTTLVNGLTARELVTRTVGPSDRRTVSLDLTPAGVHAVQQWQETNTAILGGALNELHPAWQHVISGAIPALDELVRAIEAVAEKPAELTHPEGRRRGAPTRGPRAVAH